MAVADICRDVIHSLAERAFQLTATAPVEGCIAEFGVYQGASLETMVQLAEKYALLPLPLFYGFDTFAGIPASGVPLKHKLAKVFEAGQFADTSIQGVQTRVPSATLVASEFATLEPLSSYGIEKVRLVHLDCDIYEGYRDALALLTPHVQVGTVVMCDESIPPNHWSRVSIREHGQRALREWEEKTDFNLHLIRFEWSVGLYVIVDETYLRAHWRVVDRLRRDTLRESAENIVRRLLGRPLETRPGGGNPDGEA